MKKMKTLVVIPAFNEEKAIKAFIKDIRKYKYDYLVINDCSTDSTKEILEKNNFNHIDLPVNLGIAGVTRVGFKYANEHNYDCVICMDGDGQHLPEYMNDLINEVKSGYDYVVGSRFLTKKKPNTIRMLGSRIICFLIKAKTNKRISDPTSGMRAVGKKVIQEFDKSMNFYAEPDTVCYLLHKGFKVKEVQVEMKDRETGESYFANPFKSIYYMLGVILSIIFVQ